MRLNVLALSERRTRPPLILGLLVMVVCVTVETSAAVPLSSIAPEHALELMFLVGIMAVAAVWGLGMGMVAALVSAAAFDVFLTAPTGVLQPASSGFWTAMVLFTTVALLACALASLARSLTRELEARTDADISTELTRILLGAPSVSAAMPTAAGRLAASFGLSSARMTSGTVRASDDEREFVLRDNGGFVTLLVPADLNATTLQRLRERIVPCLELLLRSARDREHAAEALRAGHEELKRVVGEHDALRRLATLVARNEEPAEIFDAVAGTMGQVLGVEHSAIIRYEPDGTTVTNVGSWNYDAILDQGSRWEFENGTVASLVFHTMAPARVSDYRDSSELAAHLRQRGVVSAVGCPIVVGRHLWGAAIVCSTTAEPLPQNTEERMAEFVELARTAIVNAQNISDLRASRTRVVTAADETRRRIERDLHDGTQQRLVSLSLAVRAKGSELPPGSGLRRWLDDTASALDDTLVELQEISRGLHPSILARQGLTRTLTKLARRSAVPARLDISVEHPLPEPLQITIYYVVAEALTNAVKHAGASVVHIALSTTETAVHLRIHDDGRGGADPSQGSGLAGLADRVNALDGRLDMTSRPGQGTTLSAEIPLEPHEPLS